ncbi:unnamed protein product [Leuciscus chuanchicus]
MSRHVKTPPGPRKHLRPQRVNPREGRTGGAFSNAYQQWGQPSDNTFSPHAVQSSVSDVPVTGTLPEEVGSSLFPNRFLKRGSLKQFTSTFTGRTGTNERSSSPFSLQGSSTYGGSLKPQGTTNQFAYGSSSSYPSVSLSSTQGAAGQSATVQSSQKQFTSSYGSLSGSSPISLQGSTAYGGSLQPQATTSQFTPASPSSYNCHCVSLSSPQDVASVSATVQSLQKQFTSSYGLPSQSGSPTPFSLQGSTTYGGSLQPQATTSQFASASPSYNCHCVSLSSPQDVASQSNQASQSHAVSQSQKSQRWQPSQGIQTSGVVTSQGISLIQSSPVKSRFSSLSSAGGSSRDSGLFVSAQDGSTSYGGLSLPSQRPSSKYTPESHAYAKLGYAPLSISRQSISNRRTNGLYSSDSRLTQGLIGVVERTSRLSSQAPSTSPSSKKISERFETLQHLTGSNRAPSLGLSAQASPVGMFSGIPQTAQALRESGSGVQLFKHYYPRQGLRDYRKTA